MNLSEYAYLRQQQPDAPLTTPDGEPIDYVGPDDYMPKEERDTLFPKGLPAPQHSGMLARLAQASAAQDAGTPEAQTQTLPEEDKSRGEQAPAFGEKGQQSWMTENPSAVGQGMREQRKADAKASIARSVGKIVRIAATMGMGGAMAGGGGAGGAAGGATGGAATASAAAPAASSAATSAPMTSELGASMDMGGGAGVPSTGGAGSGMGGLSEYADYAQRAQKMMKQGGGEEGEDGKPAPSMAAGLESYDLSGPEGITNWIAGSRRAKSEGLLARIQGGGLVTTNGGRYFAG